MIRETSKKVKEEEDEEEEKEEWLKEAINVHNKT